MRPETPLPLTVTTTTPTVVLSRRQRLTLLARLTALCVGVRIALEAIGLASLAAHGQPVWSNVLQLWNRWDAPHYLRLAEIGYVSSPAPAPDDPLFIVFFPGLPLAVLVVSLLVRDVLLSGLLVSLVASVGAGFFLHRLVALDSGEAAGWRAVILLFSFPTAYFLVAPFTESLFLCAVLACVYTARTGTWARAGLVGALATGTRMTGVALAPVLLTEVFTGRVGTAQRVQRLAWAALAGVGLITYLGINWALHGDPLYFVTVQREHWSNAFAWPWEPIHVAVTALLAGGNDFTFAFIYWGRILGALIAIALLLVAARRLRRGDVLYGWAGLIVMLCSSWLVSLPRYLLGLYPLFMVGAMLTRSRWVLVPVVAAGSVGQGWVDVAVRGR